MATYKFECPDCHVEVDYTYKPIDVPMEAVRSALSPPVESVYLTCKNDHTHKYYLDDATEE